MTEQRNSDKTDYGGWYLSDTLLKGILVIVSKHIFYNEEMRNIFQDISLFDVRKSLHFFLFNVIKSYLPQKLIYNMIELFNSNEW